MPGQYQNPEALEFISTFCMLRKTPLSYISLFTINIITQQCSMTSYIIYSYVLECIIINLPRLTAVVPGHFP
jgi:hypothetical protein